MKLRPEDHRAPSPPNSGEKVADRADEGVLEGIISLKDAYKIPLTLSFSPPPERNNKTWPVECGREDTISPRLGYSLLPLPTMSLHSQQSMTNMLVFRAVVIGPPESACLALWSPPSSRS